MNNFIKCKACGYVMKAGKVKDVCPACGVPAKAFEPYKDPLSEKRSRLLELHLHPILVHFPQSFASLIPFLLVCGWLLPGPFRNELLTAASVLIYLLPLTIIPAILAGFVDGKTRFKSVKTQILIKKIILGIVLFAFTIVVAAIVFLGGITDSTFPWLLLLSVVCTAFAVLLGNLGGTIVEAKLPG
jgi:uncharacterized membrane protein